MVKRLNIYFKEMYPIIPRLLLGGIVFFEIYFIILLNNGVTDFHITLAEFIGGFTVLSTTLELEPCLTRITTRTPSRDVSSLM